MHLVKHKHVRAIVTTAGGIEEDFIKCLGKTYLADFNLDGADLRRRGMNRIGNLIVPNDNYCKFEDWLMPILDTMLAEQKETGQVWSPSSFIHRLGKEINNEESVYYWAYKVNIFHWYPSKISVYLSVERYTRVLSCPHGRLTRRHDIFPFIQESGPCCRYRTGYTRPERTVEKIAKSRHDHIGRGSL